MLTRAWMWPVRSAYADRLVFMEMPPSRGCTDGSTPPSRGKAAASPPSAREFPGRLPAHTGRPRAVAWTIVLGAPVPVTTDPATRFRGAPLRHDAPSRPRGRSSRHGPVLWDMSQHAATEVLMRTLSHFLAGPSEHGLRLSAGGWEASRSTADRRQLGRVYRTARWSSQGR